MDEIFSFIPIGTQWEENEHKQEKNPFVVETTEGQHDIQVYIPEPQPQPQPTTQSNSMEDKDKELHEIQKIIENKRHTLWEKQKNLREISSQNKFLKKVRKDYLKYNSYVVGQKTRQIQTMNMIHDYLGDLQKQGTLSEQNVHDALQEQKNILTELNSIKANLNNIIDKDIDSDSDSSNSSDSSDSSNSSDSE